MRILPEIGPLTKPFWDAARCGQLAVQECPSCSRLQHPPLPVCAHCQAAPLRWRQLDARGVLYAFTVIHHATHIAFADRVPYAVGLVEVSPGVRVLAGLMAGADELRIGMPLVGMFRCISPEVVLIEFATPGSDPGVSTDPR